MSLYTLDFISNDPYHLDFYGITGLGGIPGLTDIYWERDTDRLFPRTILDAVCLGISTRFSDELLRIYGAVHAEEYRLGSDSIYVSYDVLGNLTLSDTITGTKKLSELIPLDPVKILVDVATTTNITLSGEQNIDSIATSSSKILVKNQVDPANNGIYITSSGTWARAIDYSTWDELYKSYIAVIDGALNGNNTYICTIPSTGTLGVNAVTFSLFSALPETIADDILNWNIDRYRPYPAQQLFISFDTSVSDPVLTTRVNANCNLHATNLQAGIINAGTGFRIGGIATTKNILRGNGTNFVSSASTALTKTDDTNVTLALGGTPATALLDAVSLTLGWTGQLSLARGGTNAGLTAVNGGIVYSTASALAISLAGSSGQILKSAGEATPTWNTPAALSKSDDTNVTLALGGSYSTALVNAASLTLGWTGTLAAARLNANVVQAITNDTNVTGSIATQTLTLGWSGQLSVTRGGTGTDDIPAYSVVCGGTTSTSPLQVVASVGDTGHVLTSNGAGVLPSFQAAPAASKWTQSGNNIYRPSYNVGIDIDPSGYSILEVSPNVSTVLTPTNMYTYPAILGRAGLGTVTFTGTTYIPEWALIGGVFVGSKVGDNWCNIGVFGFGEGTGSTGGSIGGLFSANDTGAGTAIGVYIKGVTSSSGYTYGIYQEGGGFNYFAAGVGIGVTAASTLFMFDVEGATTDSFKFGGTHPIYLINNAPNIGFNAYYRSGWKFGKGSSSNLGGDIAFDPSAGGFIFNQTSAAGNAGAAATMIPLATLDASGNLLTVGYTGSKGSSSGRVSFAAAETGDDCDYIWPDSIGTAGYVLCTNAGGALTWEPRAASKTLHIVHGADITENTVFDTLSPYIPTTNNEIQISGSIDLGTPDAGYPWMVVSYAKRLSSTQITFYGIGFDLSDSTVYSWSSTVTDGDTGTYPAVSISWMG